MTVPSSNSSTSSMDEEGEIIESEAEKAPPSLPSVSGHTVDRHSSRNRDSRSPSYDDRRNSRNYHDERYLYCREPYRSRDDIDYSRKRRRSEERAKLDPRQHRVHYEVPNPDPGRRQRVSYADIDRNTVPDIPPPRRYNGDSREYKRSRTKSRSPPRVPRNTFEANSNRSDRRYFREERYERRDRSVNYEERQRGSSGHSRERSVSDRGAPPVSSEPSKRDAEDKNKLADSQQLKAPQPEAEHKAMNGRSASGDTKSEKIEIAGAKATPVQQVAAQDGLVDETRLIEERRKRREAIKAKYRGQSTPLLVSALSIDKSTPNSPGKVESLVSGKPVARSSPTSEVEIREVSPSARLDDSQNELPADFDLDKEVEKRIETKDKQNTDEDDGPSAADYDPTMDMEEEKKRKQIQDEVSASSYDETKTNVRDVLVPDSMMEVDQEERKDEEGRDDDFDMFAEDDDDMFSEAPEKRKPVQPTMAKAVQIIPQAKQLDASMLDNWDDSEGYYRVILAELLDGRYHVQANLGKGMFSGVVRSLDMKTQKLVAIKIVRNNETMKKSGLKEIEVLKKLAQADPDDKKHIVRLERSFEHKGHLCMVFEHLSINLREVLKKFGRDVGISLKAVRAYAQQMFLGLLLMRKCNILHADLKPDNILVNESRNILKICDLGSASDASENEITPYLVSRYYRAPEIILGIPYDFAIDMWSTGCTLYELYTGKILFTGRTNNQMLRSMMECRGKFSHKLLKRGQFTHLHFDEVMNFRSVEKDKITGKDVVKMMNFTKPTRELKPRLLASASKMSDAELKELNMFIDLLDKCLNLNPEKRCTPSEALKHPFIYRPLTK